MFSIEKFETLFPLVKILSLNNNLYVYDARSKLLASIKLAEIETIYNHFFHGDKNVPEHIQALLTNNIFCPGGFARVTPSAEETKKHAENQLNSYLPRKFSIEVTEDCTLRCKYCFFTTEDKNKRKHSPRIMHKSIAYQAIDYYFQIYVNAFSKLDSRQKSKVLQIAPPNLGWWGGEPFLNFKLIQQTQHYFETLPWTKYGIEKLYLTYSVVSNLTIFTEDILRFLINTNAWLYVSLDGDSVAHDTNRVDSTGNGSFKRVYNNLSTLISSAPQYAKNRVIIQSVVANNISASQATDFIHKAFNTASPRHSKIKKHLRMPHRIEKEFIAQSQFLLSPLDTYEQKYRQLLHSLSLLPKNSY